MITKYNTRIFNSVTERSNHMHNNYIKLKHRLFLKVKRNAAKRQLLCAFPFSWSICFAEESEKRVLGSGQFTLVLKGRIVSQALPAAIKVSKPSSDVTLFKSLLSEVKIMIYIGHHDNVLKLVGVCTAGIRSREYFHVFHGEGE